MYISGINTTNITQFAGKQKKNKNSSVGNNNRTSNAIIGSLMALSSLCPVNSYADNYSDDDLNSPHTEMVSESGMDDSNLLFVELNDENGIVEPTDFKYSSKQAEILGKKFFSGLKPYYGKEWSQAVDDMANNLVDIYNRVNNESYDIEHDEMVKDSYSIAYAKNGKILQTVLKSKYGDEEVVSYKYDRFGNIDRAEYKGDKVIEYRKDGTRFSLERNFSEGFSQKIKYNKRGKKQFEKTEVGYEIDEKTYDENENLIKHFNKDRWGGYQKIYNNGSLLLFTTYDGKGRVANYTDKYFEKEGEEYVVSGYLGATRRIHNNKKYNVLYKESPLDGKIIAPVRQGTTGTCYAAGIVNSLVRIPNGRRLLDRTLPSDYDNSRCVVDYKGLGKTYSFSADEISHNMSRLGRKDADYAGLIRGFEKFREDGFTEEEKENLPDFFFIGFRGDDDRRVDSGNAAEFFYALTGKKMNMSKNNKITDTDLLKAKACLNTGNGVVNAGTVSEENKNDEIPDADRAFGVMPGHNVSVTNITNDYVTIYDSVTEKETRYPVNKFKKYFSILYYSTVD